MLIIILIVIKFVIMMNMIINDRELIIDNNELELIK
jgi:hypothetical protein